MHTILDQFPKPECHDIMMCHKRDTDVSWTFHCKKYFTHIIAHFSYLTWKKNYASGDEQHETTDDSQDVAWRTGRWLLSWSSSSQHGRICLYLYKNFQQPNFYVKRTDSMFVQHSSTNKEDMCLQAGSLFTLKTKSSFNLSQMFHFSCLNKKIYCIWI